MTTDQALGRTQEAERLLMEAIQDVPLTATGPEVAAAVQAIGLKLAEQCMEPRLIAHVLIGQAEAYLKAAGQPVPEPMTPTVRAHGLLTGAIDGMVQTGLTQGEAGEMMLTFVASWLAKEDRGVAAAAFYRLADAMATPARPEMPH